MQYTEFLQYCLDDHKELPVSAKSIDWSKLLVWAEQQAIVGVVFGGIQKAGKSLNMPSDVLLKWIGLANQIENHNQLLNIRCAEVVDDFKGKGFESCILKGQGNAIMYPNPLLRTPGDIDLWLRSGKSDSTDKDVKDIIRSVKQNNPEGKANYHHIDFGEFKGVEVEAHYRPTFMNDLIGNRRLQRWMKEHEDEQFCNKITLPGQKDSISVPTWEFNVVFQLSHIYRHVIQRGIGLRQVIDYYYLLKSNTNRTNDTNIQDTLRNLGLGKIAGAMMWVLNEILGLDEKYLIAPKNEKRGRILLAEIMKGGNFGHCDVENQKATTAIQKNILRIKRDLRMMRYFPSECLWEPVFRVYHWMWRLRYILFPAFVRYYYRGQ